MPGRHRGHRRSPDLGDDSAVQARERLARLWPEQQDRGVVRRGVPIGGVKGYELCAERRAGIRRHREQEAAVIVDRDDGP